MNQETSEQSTTPGDELSSSPGDVAEVAEESSCTATTSADAEISSPPVIPVGDTLSKDPCEGSDCAIAPQCRQTSEAGAGEVGTALAEGQPVTVPSACSDCTASDTTSVLSTSSDSKCAQDSNIASQIAETTAAFDTHMSLTRKSSSQRERQQMEIAEKPARLVRTADDSVEKPSESSVMLSFLLLLVTRALREYRRLPRRIYSGYGYLLHLNNFQNLVGTFLSKGTSVVKFS